MSFVCIRSLLVMNTHLQVILVLQLGGVYVVQGVEPERARVHN